MKRSPPARQSRALQAKPRQIAFHLAAAACALWGAQATAYDAPYKLLIGGAFDQDRAPVTYEINRAGSDDIDDGSDAEAIRAAVRAWTCAPNSALSVKESTEDGLAAVDLTDGRNTLFWDENDEYGLGEGTLGVTIGDALEGSARTNADIVFNGAYTWSTDDRPSGTDVGSIAVHELGHFFGLDHPCDGSSPDETNCNGADRAVMTPVWSGDIDRAPRPDDEAGIQALYPAGDGHTSSCAPPFGKGERCACDGECDQGLVCVPAAGAEKSVCTSPCAADASDCGDGYACVLDLPEGDAPAPGVCVKAEGGEKPDGSVCATDGECAAGTCLLNITLGRNICRRGCTTDSDCTSGGACFDNVCLGAFAAEGACPVPEEPGCACSTRTGSPSTGAPATLGLAVIAGLASLRKRPRRARG